MSATASQSNAPDPSIGSGDRLSFTLFVAVALHGLLILGLGFSIVQRPPAPPTFEITLATHKSVKAPEQADFQAQFNQEGSGTRDEAAELSTTETPLFGDTRINRVQPLPETAARQKSQASELNRITTSSDSRLRISQQEDPEEVETQEERTGAERDLPMVSEEIASLRAKLDRQQQEYARRPRKTALTSVAAKGSPEAAYLHSWRERVEAVGNENFPEEALSKRIFGELRLMTHLNADGTIVAVKVLKSSGHSILDNAALQIIHRAAPFPPFPPEIRKEWDQLEIIRTWRFEITGLSTSAAFE